MKTSEASPSAALEAVAQRVTKRTGIHFPPNRAKDAEAAILGAMARAGVTRLADFLEQIEAGGAAWDDLLDALTVRETYFFRDREQLDALWELALPTFEARRGQGRGARVWSAGCASGEEPYTLAILLDQAGILPEAQLYATDISLAALSRAREGLYRRWSFRAMDAALVEAYFKPEGGAFRLLGSIRERVQFRQLNLAIDPYPSPGDDLVRMDLILCKNVLIYLDADTIARVARGLFETLAEGGWLAAGLSDPLLSGFAPFEAVMTGAGIVYRRPLAGDAARAKPASFIAHSIREAVTPAALPEAQSLPPISEPIEQGEAPKAAGSDEAPAVLVREEEQDEAAAEAAAIRLLANARGAAAAERAAAAAVARYPLSAELRVLLTTLLLELGRHHEAAREARAAVYIDRTLAVAHFLGATAARLLGDERAARRAYRNALALCQGAPPAEAVPLADGESAGRMAAAAAAELARLGGAEGRGGGAP